MKRSAVPFLLLVAFGGKLLIDTSISMAFPADAPEPPPARPDISFPDVTVPPAPTPPVPPAAVTTLNAGEVYVITSGSNWLILDSPTGLVRVITRPGPITISGIFAGGKGESEIRDYPQKQVTMVQAIASGRVELLCVPAGATTTKDVIRRLIDVNVGPRPPPQPPGPEPPGPKPPGPTPGPAPIPAEGLRVLVVFESSELKKLPAAQITALYSVTNSSTPLGAYIASHCAKGPDGKTPERRVWDQNAPTQNESPIWQGAMARPRKSLPWLIISTGSTGYEGPLPGSAEETLQLLRTYGGP